MHILHIINMIIEILHENGVLADRILSEIEFDSYEATRDLYKTIKLHSGQVECSPSVRSSKLYAKMKADR